MKKIIFTLLFMSSIQSIWAQDLQTKEVEKQSLEIMGSVDTYFRANFNSDYANAEIWYEKLTTNYERDILPEYYFKYSQTLKSNGTVSDADNWMVKFNGVKESASRPKELQNNKDYFVSYSN